MTEVDYQLCVSPYTISEKDCRDLTKIKGQRKHEGFERSLPKVKLCRHRPKGLYCSLPKKRRARRFYEVGCPKVKLEQEGEWSCGKVCQEGLPKAKLEQEGEGSAKKVAEGSDASRKYVARVG